MRPLRVSVVSLLAAPVAFYVVYGTFTGECAISAAARGFSGEQIPMATAADLEARANGNAITTAAQPDEFNITNRPGSVDLETTYDLTDLSIPRDQIHTLLPKDAIPSLTDPSLESVSDASDWLGGDDRVIDVTIGNQTVGVPLRILTYHEIANLTVAGRPVAATYCPLCDSVTLVSREITIADGDENAEPPTPKQTLTLEFGVSGALFNSNVLMFDQQTNSLWSQLGLKAVSGPHAGTGLDHLPVRVVSFSAFAMAHPKARLVSRDTGHDRPYEGDGYSGYFATDDLMVDVHGSAALRDDMPKKTLGLGVQLGDETWFITADALGEGYTLQTPAGPVNARATEGAGGGGVEVLASPEGVSTTQTFYYAWASFFPGSAVITEP